MAALALAAGCGGSDDGGSGGNADVDKVVETSDTGGSNETADTTVTDTADGRGGAEPSTGAVVEGVRLGTYSEGGLITIIDPATGEAVTLSDEESAERGLNVEVELTDQAFITAHLADGVVRATNLLTGESNTIFEGDDLVDLQVVDDELWVASKSGEVVVLDAATFAERTSFVVSDRVDRLAYRDGVAYALSGVPTQLYTISDDLDVTVLTPSEAFEAEIREDFADNGRDVGSFDVASNTLWLAVPNSSAGVQIDATTGEVVSVERSGGPVRTGFTAGSDGTIWYVGSDTLYQEDAVSGRQIDDARWVSQTTSAPVQTTSAPVSFGFSAAVIGTTVELRDTVIVATYADVVTYPIPAPGSKIAVTAGIEVSDVADGAEPVIVGVAAQMHLDREQDVRERSKSDANLELVNTEGNSPGVTVEKVNPRVQIEVEGDAAYLAAVQKFDWPAALADPLDTYFAALEGTTAALLGCLDVAEWCWTEEPYREAKSDEREARRELTDALQGFVEAER